LVIQATSKAAKKVAWVLDTICAMLPYSFSAGLVNPKTSSSK